MTLIGADIDMMKKMTASKPSNVKPYPADRVIIVKGAESCSSVTIPVQSRPIEKELSNGD